MEYLALEWLLSPFSPWGEEDSESSSSSTSALKQGRKTANNLTSSSSSSSSSSNSNSWTTISDDEMSAGFISFFISRYVVGLVLLGVLVNRIRHICRPARPVRLPDWKRALLRFPALLALSYTTIHLGLRCIQLWSGYHVILARDGNWLAEVVAARTSVDLPMERRQADERLLWVSYIAACVGLANSNLIRTLESTTEVPLYFNIGIFGMTLHSHRMESANGMHHYFFFIFLIMAQFLALWIMGYWRRPVIRRLHITSFFGILQAIHYARMPSERRATPLEFERAPDLLMLGFILLTVSLSALTMVITEGKIDTSRLLFNRSNLPSADDDYSLALFKLGTACLHSTRLVGLSRELVSIEIPEKTYVELDETAGVTMQVGFDGLIKGTEVGGLSNEIRVTKPRESDRSRNYDSMLLPSNVKLREIKRFFWAACTLFGALASIVTQRLPTIPIPRRLKRLPRMIRLAWHGQNGERRREERIAKDRTERERREKMKDLAMQSVLRRNGVKLQEGETSQEAVRRAILEGERQRGGSSGSLPPPGVSSAIWSDVLTPSHTSSNSQEMDDPEDRDWTESEAEDETTPSSRASTPSWRQRFLSPFGGDSDEEADDDEQDPDDSAALLQLARMDFDDDLSPSSTSGGQSFSRVLMAHVTADQGRPLTRSQYRTMVGQGPGRASTLPNAPSASDAQHLKDSILRRRRDGPSQEDDESRSAERERLRLCVVCCFEERTIICWPCRCLNLCDGCREELASRPGAGGSGGAGSAGSLHDCPTCRSPISGFSRVFLP